MALEKHYAEIFIGKEKDGLYFTLNIDSIANVTIFARGDYERLCENTAKDWAYYLNKKCISCYEIINGIRLKDSKRVGCAQIPDNGEFAFRKTLAEGLIKRANLRKE
jgi:hypothetical protein